MGREAKVTALEVLDRFRSDLILYLDQAGAAVDDTRDAVRRVRVWVQQEERARREGELKRLRRQLEQAESELFTSRLSSLTDHSAARQMAVTRLRRKVRETEEKLRVVKKWGKAFDSTVDPMTKKLEQLQHVLAHELPKAVTRIANVQKALDAYRRTSLEEGGPDAPEPEAGKEDEK